MIKFIPEFIASLKAPQFIFDFRPFVIKAKGSVVLGKSNSSSSLLASLVYLRMMPQWESFIYFFSDNRLKRSYVSSSCGFYIEELSRLLAGPIGGKNLIVGSLPYLGRLAYKEEPGKVRVFAMVDLGTQWVLSPLHDYLFDILKKISSDGTFDQDQAVIRLQSLLREAKCVYSYDLSAATDRLPISIQKLILEEINPGLGKAGSDLLNRRFLVPNHPSLTSNPGSVLYATGQPMGALSSWAMLALTHHFVVQWAAKRAGYSGGFDKYVVLGDDIVLTDPRVAKHYYNVMVNELAVDINLFKSLVSTKGHAEFAKRFVTPDQDLSGISLKEFSSVGMGGNNILSLMTKMRPSEYNFNRFIGRGSISAGNGSSLFRTRSISRNYLDSVLYNFCIQRDLMFQRIFQAVSYGGQPIVRSYRSKLLARQRDWKSITDSLMSSSHMGGGISSSLKPLTGQEIVQLRRLTIRLLDGWMPFVGKMKNVLVNAKVYTKFLDSGDKYLKHILYAESPFWQEMVGGRRGSFSEDLREFENFSDPLILTFDNSVAEKLKLLREDPRSGFSHENSQESFPRDIAHLFKFTSSDKKRIRIKSGEDISFYLFWGIKSFVIGRTRFDIGKISKPEEKKVEKNIGFSVPKPSSSFIAEMLEKRRREDPEYGRRF